MREVSAAGRFGELEGDMFLKWAVFGRQLGGAGDDGYPHHWSKER